METHDAVSSTTVAFRLRWDVFLSFRGEDTRYTFTNLLYDSLAKNGVRVFLDNDGLNRGDEIAPSLLEAIDDSAAAIVVLSPRYGDSRWCLEELAKICDCGKLILPVFYQVDPSDVRRQKGPFEDDFRNHEKKFESHKVLQWRKAMQKVGGIAGYPVENGNKADIIKFLVKKVLEKISSTPIGLAAFTVGLDSRVEKLMRMLDVKSNGIRVLGLHGIGGVGKTTLAKALFNKLAARFVHRSFISNVRDISAYEDGLLSIQNNLIKDLSSRPHVGDIKAGISELEMIVNEKRVILLLDDVDNVSQIEALIPKRKWFCEGSIVITTSRNIEVLNDYIGAELYEVRELDSTEALQLFSYHALRRQRPQEDFMSLSEKIVSLTGGLPLALEVFGSFLFGMRRKAEWKDAIQKLEQIHPGNLQDVLKISFDALDKEQQCIFLDIACLFVQMRMEREELIDILKVCDFAAETGIKELIDKSLIKITEYRTVWMHDQIRDMGRQIVREESVMDPAMRSRLWDRREIMSVLIDDKGAKSTQGMVLDFPKKRTVKYPSGFVISWRHFEENPNFTTAVTYIKQRYKKLFLGKEKEDEIYISAKAIETMGKLRLLQINHVNLKGKFKSFPAGLKWLQWKECPLKSLPDDFYAPQLALIDLSNSKIEQLWGSKNIKVAENLKIMNLRDCHFLATIPDLSRHQNLEKLILENCTTLTQIHDSIGNMQTLIHLNLRACSNLVKLPSDVSGLKNLETLILSRCLKLKELPENVGSMVSLKKLLADETPIAILPDSAFKLTQLEELSLRKCMHFKILPFWIGKLSSLKRLSLDESALEELPDSISCLENIEELSVMGCKSLKVIPDSISNLESLTEFSLLSSPIEELPLSIGTLPNLKKLHVGGGGFLKELPHSIGELNSLVVLHIEETKIKNLPDQIGALKLLEKLELLECNSLESLPGSIGSMRRLTSLIIYEAIITELPESIGNLESLVFLQLTSCKELCYLPASIGKLKSLQHLLMGDTGVTKLPESFGMLSSLIYLEMAKNPHLEQPKNKQREVVTCSSLQEETDTCDVLPASFSDLSLLSELHAASCNISGKISDDFEKLSLLEILDLGHNDFCSLPSSLKGLSVLGKLKLRHCRKLKSLPPLPSSLVEIDVANCIALETVSDLSDLGRLESLNLTNCEKVVDIPGLECLCSLRRLFMNCCKTCSSVVRRRLAKGSLRNIRNLSMPGTKIPSWFSQEVVTFSKHRNRPIKAVVIGVVVCLDLQLQDDLRDRLPYVVDIQARILKMGFPIFTTALYLLGVPNKNEDQFHLCRFSVHSSLVSQLKEGYQIEVIKRNPSHVQGVELKKWGIHLVYEGDDDYEGDENSLSESQQSISEKLTMFFEKYEEEDDSISERKVMVKEIKKKEQISATFDKGYFIIIFVVLPLVIVFISWLCLHHET
ncbi:hypothetical protein UlMin_041314 [Ulmus minor]